MSTVEIIAWIAGVPALLVALLAAQILSRPGPHPPTYRMSQPWTHPPILWAAVDEAVGERHGSGAAEFRVGGGASGSW